jgi:hypothetical protein
MSRGPWRGESIPLLRLKVTVIGALDLSCLHEDLGRRAVDALLEACLPSVSVFSEVAFGLRLTGPRHGCGGCSVVFLACVVLLSLGLCCQYSHEWLLWLLGGGRRGYCGDRMFLDAASRASSVMVGRDYCATGQ